MTKRLLLTFLVLLFCSTVALAWQAEISKVPYQSETVQQVTINGENISLRTVAGTMIVRDENNEPIANFGFTSYTKRQSAKDGTIDKTRPIMFAYNGGPGSSSFWLHMGVLGPKRIVVDDPNFNKAAPYQLVNNEHSLLDMADLVMIDPVGTGLSVPAGESEFKDFWGVDQDIRSISLFITQYLIREGRIEFTQVFAGRKLWHFQECRHYGSPAKPGIALNGVIMVSAVFDLRSLMFPPTMTCLISCTSLLMRLLPGIIRK